MVRLNHTGPRATRETVLANVLALGQALHSLGQPADLDAASGAVAASYAAAGPQQPRSGDLRA
jgi:hypothetical protein